MASNDNDNKGKYTSGDIIYIAQNIANSDKPFIVEGIKDFSDLTGEDEKHRNPDRRINYLDSSIWLRYSNNLSTLKAIRQEFCKYDALKLYETSRAIENREFMARLCQNSRLIVDGGHGGQIAPFLFHSETEMKEKYIDEVKKLKSIVMKDADRKIEWRMLIVDDQATEEKAINTEKIVPKCKIIKTWLSDLEFNWNCVSDNIEKCPKYKEECPKHEGKCTKSTENTANINIHMDCAESIAEAEHKLQTKKYDFVLLDYLLGKSFDENGSETENREYAFKLLQDINKVFDEETDEEEQISYYIFDKSDSKDSKYKLTEGTLKDFRVYWLKTACPQTNNESDYDTVEPEIRMKKINRLKGTGGRFRFFFMSAFTSAVNERMLQLGLTFNTSYWHISRGACPTTTPNLFMFYLVKSMHNQIKKLTDNGIDKKVKFADKKADRKIISLCDLMAVIYQAKEERSNAMRCFNAILKMRANYDQYKYDICIDINGHKTRNKDNYSFLINSLFPDIPYYDNAFWEHTMHLVYLTAYGTIRQWHDMWEEFMLIKPYLKRVGGEHVINGIENHIFELQNQSR
jgi:hypothetical protein